MAVVNRGEADHRRPWVFRDQHNRAYDAVIETRKKGGPTGPITPRGWKPPHRLLMPDTKYMRFDVEEPGRFVVDYETWMADLREAHHDYNVLVYKVAQAMYGDKAGEAVREMPPQLLQEVGPRPMALELVAAMQQGNQWALGLVETDVKNVARFLPKEDLPVIGDFSDLDELLDLEEEVDPEATGGKVEPIRRRPTRPARVAAATSPEG